MMPLLDFFKHEVKLADWKFVLIMAISSGIANAFLLGVVNKAAQLAADKDSNLYFLALFFVVFLIFFFAKRFALGVAAEQVEHIIKDVRLRVSKKITKTTLRKLEELDTSVIYTRLTQDTNLLSQVAIVMINSAQASIMVLFSLCYILWVSKLAFVITLVLIVCGIGLYASHSKVISQELEESSKMEASFFDSLDSILHGFKELKINTRKRHEQYEHHVEVLDGLEAVRKKTSARFITNLMFSQVSLYLLIATIVFLLPQLYETHSETVIKVTAAILFIIGPLEMIASGIPIYAKANVAAKNIAKLEKNLNNQAAQEANAHLDFCEELVLKDVHFEYLDKEKKRLFALSHINLRITQGSVVFIAGGNGSGKSTLIKLLLGLYTPTEGSLEVDGELIDKNNIVSYRELFSIILTDFYLFKKLYGLKDVDIKQAKSLLKEMGLLNKTKFLDNAFTNLDLSTGQRKRLALINTILEDKDIYIFDEWAADQDPEFREYFYNTILQELKNSGKTVIAITHDDKYFHVADALYKMQDGTLSTVERTKAEV